MRRNRSRYISSVCVIQSTSDIRDPPGPAQLIPYIRISLITGKRKIRSDTLRTQVLNAQNTLFEAFHTFPVRKLDENAQNKLNKQVGQLLICQLPSKPTSMLYCTVQYCIHIATVTYSDEKVRNFPKRLIQSNTRFYRESKMPVNSKCAL